MFFFTKLLPTLRRVLLLLLVLYIGFSSPLLAAEGGAQKSLRTGGESPWTLYADNLVSLDDGVIVEASGNVLLQRDNDYLKADFARYYTTTNWIYLKGHVDARMGRDTLNASEAEFDVHSRTGWLKDGSIFVAGPHMYVSGEKVDKLFGDRYVFKNARVTACDGDVPAWSLDTDRAEVEIDGYAKLYRSTLNILDIPLAGTPFLVLPAKTTRQSGLLMPDAGYSSLNGGFFSLPYYQVIDESRDLTFTGTFMSRAGFMPSLEYRSHTRSQDKTWLALDVLYDKHIFNTETGDRVNDTDRKINTQQERYWLRGMGDGYVGDSEWRYRYNLDYVSDQNFLREFRDRYTGFNRSRDAMFDTFGRDIPEVDKNRVSEGFLYREWDRFMVSLGFRYEEIPSLGHGNTHHNEDTTVQSIPLNLYLYKGRILENLPLEAQAEFNTAYEYRAKGVRGLRTELHPEISLPVYLPGASLLLNGGVRQTLYNTNTVANRATAVWTRGSGNKDRTIPEFSVTAFSQLSRVWDFSDRAPAPTKANVGESKITGLRHRIQPRLTYGLITDEDQTMNPYFEGMDRIRPSEMMRLSLTNILTTRRSSISGANGSYKENVSYADPLRWELAAGYDMEEARREKFRDTYERRPFTDAYSSIQLSPVRWFSVWNRTYLSMYGEGITRSDTGVSLRNSRWGGWSLSYSTRNNYYNYLEEMKRDRIADMRFTREQRLMTNTFTFTPIKNVRFYYLTTANLITNENYERRFIAGYYHQCFHVLGVIHSKGRDHSYRVILELPGMNF